MLAEKKRDDQKSTSDKHHQQQTTGSTSVTLLGILGNRLSTDREASRLFKDVPLVGLQAELSGVVPQYESCSKNYRVCME